MKKFSVSQEVSNTRANIQQYFMVKMKLDKEIHYIQCLKNKLRCAQCKRRVEIYYGTI